MCMPVRQRCPQCGEYFMGSDAIGDKCSKCRKVVNYESYKELFKILARGEENVGMDNNA